MRLIKAKSIVSVLAVISVSALAQTGGHYELTWTTIDGGGGTSTGGTYILAGTIGQPEASYSGAGKYGLLGGFWPGGPVCIVQFDDFARFAEQWLESGSGLAGDLDRDSDVDSQDLSRLADYWLECCPHGWTLR